MPIRARDTHPSDESWPVASPLPGEPPIEWVFSRGLPKGFHWNGEFFHQGDPRLDLANLPCSEGGLAYPASFRVDPQTGRMLSRAPGDGMLSGFPCLGADGFNVLPVPLDLAVNKWRAAELPKGAAALFRAGSPSRPFCLTSQGELLFRGDDGTWTWLDKMVPLDGPKTSFAIASGARGFAMVLADSAIICRLIDGIPGVVKEIERFAGAHFRGPPSLLGHAHLAFPLQRPEGLVIAIYDMEAGGWAADIPVEADTGTDAAGERFTAPVQNSAQVPDVYWCARTTFLHLSLEHNERVARLHRLGEGKALIPGAPMLRDVEETVYALSRVDGNYAFTSLTPKSRSVALNGPHLAAGRARYNGRDFYPSIASDDMVTFRIEAGAGRLILPVAFGTDPRGATEGCLIVLVEDVYDVDAFLAGTGEVYRRGTLYWHSHAQLYPFRITLNLRSPFDLLVLCDPGCLIVSSAGRTYEVREG